MTPKNHQQISILIQIQYIKFKRVKRKFTHRKFIYVNYNRQHLSQLKFKSTKFTLNHKLKNHQYMFMSDKENLEHHRRLLLKQHRRHRHHNPTQINLLSIINMFHNQNNHHNRFVFQLDFS